MLIKSFSGFIIGFSQRQFSAAGGNASKSDLGDRDGFTNLFFQNPTETPTVCLPSLPMVIWYSWLLWNLGLTMVWVPCSNYLVGRSDNSTGICDIINMDKHATLQRTAPTTKNHPDHKCQ